MRKILSLIISLILLVGSATASTMNVSGRAGVYVSPDGTSSMMYGVSSSYNLTPNLSLRGALETTTYTSNNVQTTYTPVTLDLIYSQDLAGIVNPYAGAGVSYNSITTGGNTSQTAGAQAEAGLRFNLGGFSAGVEYRVIVPDLNKTNVTSSSYNAYATGAFSQSFSF